MKSNLDALEAMIAEQNAKESEAKAKAEKPKSGFKAKWSERGKSQTNGEGGTQGREQILEMCSKVDLLSLAQADTGEPGRRSGNRVDFHSCPLCGHKDCFTVYTDTNTCACFSESNENADDHKQAAGGNVLDYLRYARHDGDNVAAMTELHELSGIPYEPKDKSTDLDEDEIFNGWNDDGQDAKSDGTDNADQDAPKLLLPPWKAIRATDPPPLAPPLIPGILRRGCIAALAGKAKVGKSIAAIELCVSVAVGGEWFGRSIKGGGKCLFIDPEIKPDELDKRFSAVCWAMGANSKVVDSKVIKWSLRGAMTPQGKPATIATVAHDIEARCTIGDFDLIVVDSASALLEGNENESIEVRKYFSRVLYISKVTGAAVLLILHYGKTLAGDRSAADRARGSSVWTDAPDAVLTITEILPPSGEPSDYLDPNEYACLFESGGLRSFGRMEPTRLIFKYPNPKTDPDPVTPHRVDDDCITEGWKPTSSQGNAGKESGKVRKARAEAKQLKNETLIASYFIRNGIGAEGVGITKLAREVFGVSRTEGVKAIIEKSAIFGTLNPSPNRCNVVAVEPPPEEPEENEQPPTLDLEG